MTIKIRAKDAIKGLFILGFASLLTACGGSGGKSNSNSHAATNTPSSVSSLAVSSVSSSSVIPAPSALIYSSPQVFKLNTAITALNATVTGTVTSYSVLPALPAGLVLNATSGQITGTPTVVSSATDYTITATNGTGSTSFTLSIAINSYVNLSNFQEASVVIGHSDFVSSKIFLNASTLNQLNGNPFISDAGKLYIADTNFSRVLGYNNLPTVNGAAADFVVGQPDFTTITSAVTQAGMTLPTQVISSQGKFLVVGRWRITIYNSLPTATGAIADVVVGQADFNSGKSFCDANTLNIVGAAAVTPSGKLIATDPYHNRVLIWNSLPTTNGQAADIVLGQNDFIHCSQNDSDQDHYPESTPSQSTLNFPSGIWADDTHIVVSDTYNNRVLIWNSMPTSNFAKADLVLGQTDFEQKNVASPTASTLNNPTHGVHSNGIQLAIADTGNHRVLVWNTFPTTNAAPADIVLGQFDFTISTPNDANHDGAGDSTPSAGTLKRPQGVLFYNDQLLVTDTDNNRMLIFKSQ